MLSTLILLLVITAPAYSQSQEETVSGRLITADADTLYGKIFIGDQYDHSWRVQFQEEGSDTYTVYRPHEVFMYKKEGSFSYFSVEGDFENYGLLTVFIREDISGEVSLYSTILPRGEAAFFVRGRDGRLIYLQRGFYIDQLRSLFSDCNEFLHGSDRMSRRYRLTHEGMYRAFTSYYECADSEAQWITVPQGTTRTTKFGVIAGPSYSRTIESSPLSVFRNVTYGYSFNYTAGILLDTRLRRTNVYARPEFNYTYVSSELSDFDVDRGVLKYARAEMHMISIEAPFRYEFNYKNSRPYLGGGAAVGYIIDEKLTLKETLLSTGTEVRQSEVDLHSTFAPGFSLKAGVRFQELFGDSDLFTEVRFRYAYTDDLNANALNGIFAFNLLVAITF